MTLNRTLYRGRCQVVHEARFRTKSPQHLCPQLVLCVLRSSLYDAISCSDIVQQEITVRMEDLVPDCIRHYVCSAVQRSTWSNRCHLIYMANAALHLLEQRLAVA